MIIGLTGQSGAGKTTVSDIFRNHGFNIVNCDIISRKVVEPNTKGFAAVINAFDGFDITDKKDNLIELNRKKLGEIVFSDKDKLNLLNKTIYPFILEEISKIISKQSIKDILILDAPTLFDSGADKLCDKIISVISDENIRLDRIIKRDGINKEYAVKRLNSQQKDSFFIDNSHFIIKNDGDLDELKKQAELIANEIKNKNDCSC